jgi:DNA-binding transcriptional MerR regulator
VAKNVGITSDGYYSTSALAKKLGVGIHTIYYWRDKGAIEVIQNPDSDL